MPRLDVELRHAQKLEALGQLAAGIAHEISTPVQFVGDSVSFLRGAFADLQVFAEGVKAIVAGGPSADGAPETPDELRAALRALMEANDVDYLINRVPRAVDRVVDGLGRVSGILRAMKDFSHPDQREKAPADLNDAVERALTITRGEYKHVAEVKTELADLPRIRCHVGDVQQVLVNLVTNAAHAIEARAREQGRRGLIEVKTYEEQVGARTLAVVSVRDDGIGIPAAVQPHVFEPFFTTKELGRGTGQGLAISRAIVVDRHEGQIVFETCPGQGTTFFVKLPLS